MSCYVYSIFACVLICTFLLFFYHEVLGVIYYFQNALRHTHTHKHTYAHKTHAYTQSHTKIHTRKVYISHAHR